MTRRRLQALTDALVRAESVTGAAAALLTPGRAVTSGADRASVEHDATFDLATPFDLASLTKPFTATLALLLEQEGEMPLDLRLGEVWDSVDAALATRTAEDLLRHRSGLTAWTPLYHRCSAPEETSELLLSGELSGAAPEAYSDLGYILWGLTAERRTGRSLRELFEARLPQRFEGALWLGPRAGAEAVESRLDNDRERALGREQGFEVTPRERPRPGEAQDGNAHFLGGLAGHAGLFGSLDALRGLAEEWLSPGEWLEPESVRKALGGEAAYALGWALGPALGSWSSGLEAGAFGHVGFTGGALWIEPDAGRAAILLASRDSMSVDLGPWRGRLQELTERA